MMYNVDYNMAEYTSDYIYKKLVDGNSVPNDILENFMTSIAYLTIHKEPLGPKAMLLQDYLNALYSYDHINRLEKFDLGAVYGTTTFFKKMMDIKEGINYESSVQHVYTNPYRKSSISSSIYI